MGRAIRDRFAQLLDVPAGNGVWARLAGVLQWLTFDTDGTLGANSDSRVPTQKAVKTAITSAVSGSITATAVKTANYAAAAGDFVPVDTTAGAVTVTLPNAPADGTRVGIKHVIQGGTNTVTVACAGADVFNKAGGSTTGTLSLLNQGFILHYKASGAIWYVEADDLPLSQLDLRYPVATLDIDGTLAANSDAKVPSEKAVKTYVDAAKQDPWLPSGAVFQTFPRAWLNISVPHVAQQELGLTSGQMRLAGGITLPAGQPIHAISLWSGDVAAVNPTHQWFCLIRLSDMKVIAVTVDDLTTAWTTFTEKKLQIATADYTPAADTAAYVGILVTAGTMPKLLGLNPNTASVINDSAVNVAPYIGGQSLTTGLTTPVALGTVISAPSSYKVPAYALGWAPA